jgi:uncharacterized RDD family membrane protein YckC
MRDIGNYRDRVLLLLLVAASFVVLLALTWLWEQLDATGRTLLLLAVSVALYGFGCLMDRITGRSGNEKGKRR